jgi:hypothetical protein
VVKQQRKRGAATAELKKLRRQVEAFHVYHLKDLMETGILTLSEFKEAVDPLLNASDDYYEAFFVDAHMRTVVVTVPNN